MATLKHLVALFKPGSNIGVFEALIAYLLPVLYFISPAVMLKELFLWNFACQLLLFLLFVQIPLAITGKMSYVDLGWPCGLVILGLNGLLTGSGWYVRRYVVCGCMILHGGRMFLGIYIITQICETNILHKNMIGALFLFYPYTFKHGDLSRYQFAKNKWIFEEGLSEKVWPIKAQFDTLTQCFANSVVLACPILLASLNPLQEFHILEVIGIGVWLLAWLFENMADFQKHSFLRTCREASKSAGEKEKSAIKNAVLGYAPWNSKAYWMWTCCRHPNYFCEWCAWVGFAVMGCGSVVTKDEWLVGGAGFASSLLLYTTMWMMLRFFYDCLVYWTGAGPAEAGSVLKRPLYRDYQRHTRVFFPFHIPTLLINHHLTPGWPNSHITDKSK